MAENIEQDEDKEDRRKDLEKIHSMVLEKMDLSNDGYEFICERIKEELDFKSGKQWTDEDEAARDGRPCLVIDKQGKYLDKVEGYFRNNPPQSRVVPRFNATEDDAKIIKGYLRSFMASESTKQAVQTACSHMAAVGYGWAFVSYAKENPRSFDEYIPVAKRIEDPRSVRIDRSSSELDASDATWVALLRTESRKSAEEEADGNEDMLYSFDSVPNEYADQWVKDDLVILCDFWWKEDVDETLTEIRMRINGTKRRLYSDELKRLQPETYEVVRSAKTKRTVVKMATVSGAGVLHTQDWPGTDLPIVPFYGAQAWNGDRKFYTGLVRKGMDAQKLINYYSSNSAEVTALSPRVPYILAEQQKEGHEEEWDTSTVENYANMTYKHVDGIPPPQRAQQAPDVAPLLNAVTSATNDLADVMGMYDASLGKETNQKSGTAIEKASQNSDQVIAVMIDNGRRSVIRMTEIAVHMLPFLFTEERTIKYMSEEGDEAEIPVNTATPQPVKGVNGIQQSAIDLTTAVFDVIVEEGETYQTRKQESAKGGIDLIGILPEAVRAPVAAEVVRNLPWPNAKKLSRIISATLPPEIKSVVEGDENTEEDPKALAIMQGMKQEIDTIEQELAQKDAENNDLRMALQQLQMAVLSTAQDNETKLQIAAMKNRTELEIAQIEAGVVLETSSAELRMDAVIQEMKDRQQNNAKQMDAALKLAEKYLGSPSVGPSGTVNGQLRGVPG